MPKPQFETELSEIFELFKSVMKKEKLKYRDLAKRLEMSESGLKKIFSAGDCSFNRLSQIAATLDLSLSEIFDDLRNSTPSQLEFAQSTDRFLSENFDYFRFYWRLFYERMSVEEIQKSDALSKKQVFKYLRKLDQLQLIELHENNRVKLPRAQFSYFKNSQLLQKMKNEWAKQVFTDAASNDFNGKKFFTFYYLKLDDATLTKLTNEWMELIQQYTRESVRNINLKKKDVRDYRMVSCIASGSFAQK